MWNVYLIKGDWKTISAKFCFLGAHGTKYFSILVNNAHLKGVFRGGSTSTSAGFPLSIRKLSCDMWIGFHRWNYIYPATTWHKKWYCLGCSCCSKLSLKRDLLRSKLFIYKLWRDINFVRTIPNTSKTLRKLLVCGVESLTLIKFFCFSSCR